MTLKSIMVLLIMAFMFSAAAAVAASAADLSSPYGQGRYAACVSDAHKVISQHEATKLVLKEQMARRPHGFEARIEASERIIVPGVIMPEEYRAKLIAERVAECRRLYS